MSAPPPPPPADEVAALRGEVTALRRLVRVVLALALAALGVAGWAASRGGGAGSWAPGRGRALQVEAQEYHLYDPDGNLRGVWKCPPAGPTMSLLDRDGRMAVELYQEPGGGGHLLLNDAAGKAVFKKPE